MQVHRQHQHPHREDSAALCCWSISNHAVQFIFVVYGVSPFRSVLGVQREKLVSCHSFVPSFIHPHRRRLHGTVLLGVIEPRHSVLPCRLVDHHFQVSLSFIHFIHPFSPISHPNPQESSSSSFCTSCFLYPACLPCVLSSALSLVVNCPNNCSGRGDCNQRTAQCTCWTPFYSSNCSLRKLKEMSGEEAEIAQGA